MRALTTLVLASVSPRRRELLGSLKIDVRIVPSDVEEGPRPGLSPLDLARAHAAAKASAVALRETSALVVAADTVVDLDGEALGKPVDASHARSMLRSLAGREHRVHTAYVARDGASGREIASAVSTTVRFAALADATIDAYIASGDPFDKAGAYGIQGPGAGLVEHIDGDFYTVMGFPLGDFIRRLPELGYELPQLAMNAA
jgi:septum formation protein